MKELSEINLPEDVRYTKDHEWAKVEGEVATIGITDHAQEQLGELVFVELPDVGKEFAAHKEIAVVESSKAAGDVSACLVPRRGMYLAGGIVTKNERFFVEDDLFMRHFEACYHPNIQRLLKTIPVFIVKDYSVSLLGAANAARSFFG